MRPLRPRAADALAIAFLVAILTILFADVLFTGNNFYVRDVALQYYPIRRDLHDVVASGHFPFWNPRISAGQPLAANPGYETFYPFQWPIFLPDFDFGFRFTIVLHFYIAATGIYLLLRSLGTRVAAALFGALTFVLGGMYLSLANLLPFLFSAAWLPWIGFFWRRSNLALTALALGMLLLAADQSMILQTMALLIAIGFRRKRALAFVLGAAFLIGAVQLIPALDLQFDSARSLPLPAAGWTLAPYRPLELIFPNFDSWYSKELTLIWSRRFHPEFPTPLVFSFYPGLLAGVLIIAGFVCRIRGWKFVAGWTMVSYLVAIGAVSPILRVLSIRYPEKFFISAVFVMSIFAAIVFDELQGKVLRAAMIVSGSVAAISAVMYLFTNRSLFAAIWHESNDLFMAASRRGWILSAAMSLALLGILFVQRRMALLVAFVLFDLGSRVNGLVPRMERGYYDPPPAARALAAEHRPIRIYNDADRTRRSAPLPNVPLQARLWAIRNGMIPRMEEIWGFGGVFEEDLDLTTLLPTREMTRTFRELLAKRPDRAALMLAQAGVTHVGVLEIPDVPRDVHDYNYVRFVPFAGNGHFYFASPVGKIVKATETPNAIDLDVEAGGQALLVIAITRHKYWKGIMDGKPSPPRPANIAFQYFVVPPGKHHIALRYRNPMVLIFGAISILTLVALLIAAAVPRSTAQPLPSQH
ncbi:MAG TPA: hypothetical protein VER58_04215 [Thermoanaerobaculia bacterium]|nr:hypothetical protein [Thermoanaerobaculia bacterium]